MGVSASPVSEGESFASSHDLASHSGGNWPHNSGWFRSGGDAALTGFLPHSSTSPSIDQGFFPTSSHFSAAHNRNSPREAFRSGKPKEWSKPQSSDPKKEKKRRKASQSHGNREKKKEEKLQLEETLNTINRECKDLQKEKLRLEQRVGHINKELGQREMGSATSPLYNQPYQNNYGYQ